MIIGSLVELKQSEKRVGLIPEHAKQYIDNKHEVIVESGLGLASGYSDEDYIKVGAKVFTSKEEIWEKSDMIIKVKEPMADEYALMRENQIIFTYFHLAADKDLTLALLDKQVTALAYETIEDEQGNLVLLKPMSEIAGKLAVLEGNKYLETHYGGKGILLSGTSTVKPGHVVILGVGSVGCAALEEASNLGASITALVHSEADIARVKNAYPQAEVLVSSEENIIKAISKADLLVSSVLVPGAKTNQLIKREYLKHMEVGSVIIDVAIDQGGSTETSKPTTHLDPIYAVDGIIHYCVANMAGSVPRTSSKALGDATITYGLKVANLGLEQAAKDAGIRKGINTQAGLLTNQAVANAHNLKFK